MYRILTVLTLAFLLAACGQAGTTQEPTDGSGVSQPTSPAMSSPSDDMSSGTASAECTEAFGPIAEAGVTSITELGELAEELEPTVENCASVAEWTAAAQDTLGIEVNPNTVRMLLGMQCGSPSLSNTDLCRDLESS